MPLRWWEGDVRQLRAIRKIDIGVAEQTAYVSFAELVLPDGVDRRTPASRTSQPQHIDVEFDPVRTSTITAERCLDAHKGILQYGKIACARSEQNQRIGVGRSDRGFRLREEWGTEDLGIAERLEQINCRPESLVTCGV